MRDAAFMVSWGGIEPGREREALALFKASQGFWEKREAEGKVKRVGPFFLAPGSGPADDIEGFALYLGRLDTLRAILASEEYDALHYPALRILRNVSGRFFVGGTPQEVMRIVGTATTQWQVAGVMKG